MFFDTIAAINKVVNDFVWGVPAMVCIIGVGLLLSVRTGFLQIRKFPFALKTTIGRMFHKKEAADGAMTPFQAVCTALAGTVGTGNIAGVAGAIAIGGPGAVFWMWCSALLGMCTKYAEVTLAVHYRERSATGEWIGGPMYYIKNGLGKRWQWLAILYALFGTLTVFGTGNATQVNTITTSINTALTQFHLVSDAFVPTLNLIIGIFCAMLVAMVLLGGIKRIGSVSEKLVPFMALFYVVLGIGVGGSFDKVAYLAKKALLRPLDIPNPDPYYAQLEQELLTAINALGIGPQGFGGKTTCLGLAIEQMPTHVAGLPVAVNVSCHVTRRASAEL